MRQRDGANVAMQDLQSKTLAFSDHGLFRLFGGGSGDGNSRSVGGGVCVAGTKAHTILYCCSWSISTQPQNLNLYKNLYFTLSYLRRDLYCLIYFKLITSKKVMIYQHILK